MSIAALGLAAIVIALQNLASRAKGNAGAHPRSAIGRDPCRRIGQLPKFRTIVYEEGYAALHISGSNVGDDADSEVASRPSVLQSIASP